MVIFAFRIIVLALTGWFVLPANAASRTEHVFIISIDGGASWAIQNAKMPVLKQVAREGACTWNAETLIPQTLPGHTSMLTGVGTDQHKIVWNSWIPSNGVVTFPTVFTAAKAAGLSTAMFAAKEKFQHLVQPGTVDYFDYSRAAAVVVLKSDSGGPDVRKEGVVSSRAVATNAAAYIVSHKPNLCFIHLADPDTVGHAFGWESSEERKAFAETDAAVEVILKAVRRAGIAKRSVILISADHGGHGKGHSKGTPQDMIIPWIASGQGVKKHFSIPESVHNSDVAATALWLLGVQPLRPLEGVPVVSAFKGGRN
jgi:predicted AlkP superfamily pyrophosphatase or phosphodiesterase